MPPSDKHAPGLRYRIPQYSISKRTLVLRFLLHVTIHELTLIVSELHGSQYSWLGSIVYVAQLIWQPVSSYLILKMPVAKYCEYVNFDSHVSSLTILTTQCS